MVEYENHGMSFTRVYHIWRQMRYRCSNPNAQEFKNYGGRGITVCDRWASFENFLEDMGEPDDKYTLERIDNSKGYGPDNCKWATHKEQHRNMRSNRLITAFGETRCMTEWAEIKGIPVSTLKNRLFRAKMEPEAALTAPLYAQQRGTLK